jgi:hypothetical protein
MATDRSRPWVARGASVGPRSPIVKDKATIPDRRKAAESWAAALPAAPECPL